MPCSKRAQAGGAGLTLVSANHVFLLEPALSPGIAQQAVARVHRIGQLKPVHITRFVVRDTVEVEVQRIQVRNWRERCNVAKDMPQRSPLVAAALATVVDYKNDVDIAAVVQSSDRLVSSAPDLRLRATLGGATRPALVRRHKGTLSSGAERGTRPHGREGLTENRVHRVAIHIRHAPF